MSEEEKINPGHSGVRQVLRIAGPAVVAVGLVFMIVGMGSFFASFGSFEPPRYFWCCFVGIPVLFVGLVMCKFAFMGAVPHLPGTERSRCQVLRQLRRTAV